MPDERARLRAHRRSARGRRHGSHYEADEADLIVLNTCTIRENADTKLYGYLGSLKQAKDDNPNLRIAVGGCSAQKERDIIQDRAGWVDVVFGTHNVHRVVDLLDHADEWGPITEIWEETKSTSDIPSGLPVQRESDHSAWVTITIGCNNSCTFCIVPIVRGAEISRRPGDVIREVQGLAADGVKEVTLLGQNVNSYGRDLDLNGRKPLFADLLRRVGQVDGIERIRYTSPHPKDFREDVALAMAETDAVCEQIHFPLQSGSDRILSAMHRGYTAERFLDKLAMMRSIVPDLAASTDVIVGFPGETDEDFEATLEVMAAARFDAAFMFQFSPRPGTPAATMENHVAPEVVQQRFERLIELQDAITFENNEHQVGVPRRCWSRDHQNETLMWQRRGHAETASFMFQARGNPAPCSRYGSPVQRHTISKASGSSERRSYRRAHSLREVGHRRNARRAPWGRDRVG